MRPEGFLHFHRPSMRWGQPLRRQHGRKHILPLRWLIISTSPVFQIGLIQRRDVSLAYF